MNVYEVKEQPLSEYGWVDESSNITTRILECDPHFQLSTILDRGEAHSMPDYYRLSRS